MSQIELYVRDFFLVHIQAPITNRMGSFLIRSHHNLFSSSFAVPFFDWVGFYRTLERFFFFRVYVYEEL